MTALLLLIIVGLVAGWNVAFAIAAVLVLAWCALALLTWLLGALP